MYVCLIVGITKHTQRRGGDWHRSHWREPSQEEHQSLWTHNAAFHLVLRDAQVISLFEPIWLPLRTFFFVDFTNFASAGVASSSCNSPKNCNGLIRVISVCEWWYLWPIDPPRVCFCHSPADSWDEWIDNRSASYHVQPDVILSFDRLCKPQASDIILDPMCGTGAIPLEVRCHVDSYQGDLWWPQLFKFQMCSHQKARTPSLWPLHVTLAWTLETSILAANRLLQRKAKYGLFYFYFYIFFAEQGAIEFSSSFYIAGDNNDMAVNRTVNNICHIQKRRADKGRWDGDIFLNLIFCTFVRFLNIYRSATSVSVHLDCLLTQCVGICAVYP